jgi:16S rRNA (adenine1518-N6/adenine1519-N6)-dimethyltransferase
MGSSPDVDISALPPLREVIAQHGLAARKSLGQNFLLDGNLTDRIARAAGDLTETGVVEVGPGPGGLTRALLANGAREVVAIERDPRAVTALGDLVAVADGRLRLIEGDALDFDATALVAAPRAIVANLPYNVATPLLIGWLHALAASPDAFTGLTLMFQKEVAARLTAAPGSRTYGRLSVLVQWLCEARRLFDVPARAFTPPPKVTSSVVQLLPRPEPLGEADIASLEAVTRAAFGQRRKMLRSSLKALAGDVGALLEKAEIAGEARAETLSVAQFCALARAYSP